MEQILDATEQRNNENVKYAGFWLRFVAILIDSIILGVINVIISMVLGGGIAGILKADFFSLASMLNNLIGVLYYVYFESSEKQATIGKMALGLKVTNLNGERISFVNALGRYFSKIISTIILLIGFIMAGFTEKKQALHDIIARTLVVQK